MGTGGGVCAEGMSCSVFIPGTDPVSVLISDNWHLPDLKTLRFYGFIVCCLPTVATFYTEYLLVDHIYIPAVFLKCFKN